jgi:hypothetical protein
VAEEAKPFQVLYDYSDVPTVKRFALCNDRVRLILGPFGSGKTSGCIMEIMRRAQEMTPCYDGIRRSRWAVVRNTYAQLKDTTIRSFHDWFPPKIFGEYHVTDHNYLITKFPGMHLELCFRALDRPDQVSNLLSFEFTSAYFNEAREIPKTIIDAMDGRIGRYPSKRDAGEYWHGMILDSNPPEDDSDLYNVFEKTRPEGWSIFKQPSGLSAQAENTLHLPKNYYQNLARGKDEMFVRVYVHGQYGYLVAGRPVFTAFKDNIHVAHRPLEPIKNLPLITGWDFGLCYDDETEVLTENGWKFFEDVDDKELVMTKNFETNIIEYQKPSKKIKRWHDGEMILYENHNVNFCVTPEHVIPCRKRYGHHGKVFNGTHRIAAEYLFDNVTKHYAVDIRAKWDGDSNGVFGPLGWSASVFAEFMALYLSEGSCDRVHSRINIAQETQDPVFQKILDNTKLNWIRGSKVWRITNETLNEYLKSFGYSNQKSVPTEIKNMGKEEILKFIFAYTRGDGHIRVRPNGSEEHTIFTISKRMADDFQELALKVGWHAKIRIVKPQDSIIFEDGKGRVIHNEGGYCITFKKKKGTYSEIVKNKLSKIRYAGNVYCLTVPNGTLYVRRKLTPSWNGNTPAVSIAQITPLGQLRIIDEVVSDGVLFKPFIQNQVHPVLRQKYFGMKVVGFGDMTGSNRNPTSEDTCFDILHSREIGLSDIIPAPTNDMVSRTTAVDAFLNKMVNGEPGFILSPNCHHLRKALNGGYHYEKERKAASRNEYKPSPEKNFSSHIADSLEYLCMYIVNREEDEKRWKAFASQLQKRDYRPASSEAGY